nr:zinc-dependent metalloprotease [candidate division Zixibacteria bacterium]
VAHEVGHTLGLRHNYKGSTVYSLAQLGDRSFTTVHGTTGSIMDYTPPNIGAVGQPQGEFYASVPGPYDYWVIEYGYADFGPVASPLEEKDKLAAIAGRAADPLLAYGTDEDAFGTSTKGIDPQCLTFDHGDDNVAFCEHKLALTKQLWHHTVKEFERSGEGYQTVLRAFQTGWRAYSEAAGYICRYVGGIHHNRYHVGDTAGVTPFTPVPAAEQRRAMKFLQDNIFAADAFTLPADLVNKLQPERESDFSGSIWTTQQIDYPLHEIWLGMQNAVLSRLYDPLTLGRLRNNLARVAPAADRYTMYDMFSDVRGSIWSELAQAQTINSFRRQLQLLHLQRLIQIYLSDAAAFPSDARTLAANDLDLIGTAAARAAASGKLDGMSLAHCKEVVRQIDAAKGAMRQYSKM